MPNGTLIEQHRGYDIRQIGDGYYSYYVATNTKTGIRLTDGNTIDQVRRSVDRYLDRT